MTKKKPIKKINKDFPRITIERYGLDENGHIEYIDLHDEKFGEAVFFGSGSRHYHGFYNGGEYNKKKWL